MSQWSRIPSVKIAVPFVVGCTFSNSFPVAPCWTLCLFGTCFVALIILSLNRKIRKGYVFGAVAGLALFFLAYSIEQNVPKHESSTFERKDTTLIFKIDTDLQPTINSFKTIGTICLQREHVCDLSDEKLLVYFQPGDDIQDFKPGDLIIAKCRPKPINPPLFETSFDFRSYMSSIGVSGQVFIKSDRRFKLNQCLPPSSYNPKSVQRRISHLFEEEMFGESGQAVLSAIVLGDKQELSPEAKSSFQNAGVIHILAVSGLHVGLIFIVISRLLNTIPKIPSNVKCVIIIMVLWVYAAITGMSPSVLRASTMFSFIAVGHYLNRQSDILNSIGASALFLLIIDQNLLFKAGFQLSYAAVIGIVILQPWIGKLFVSSNWLLRKIWELCSVSIAAQIATFPLAIYYFHQFPVYFLIANLIVIPLATLVLYGGLIFICLGWIPVIGDSIGFMLSIIVDALIGITEWISNLPFAVLDNIHISLIELGLIYLLIMSTIPWIRKPSSRRLSYALSICIAWSVYSSWNYLKTSESNELIFLANRGTIAITKVEGHYAATIVSDPRKPLDDLDVFLRSRGIEHEYDSIPRSNENHHFFKISDENILILNRRWKVPLVPDSAEWCIIQEPLNMDSVWEKLPTDCKILVSVEWEKFRKELITESKSRGHKTRDLFSEKVLIADLNSD